jgi:hypothetical protein
MNDLDRDLKRLLDNAAAGIEPRTSSRSRTLRRARRKRMVNATVGGGLALALVAGGLFGALRIVDNAPNRADVAGNSMSSHLAVPEDEVEIARGDSANVPWLLSTRPDQSCLTITLGLVNEVVSSSECGGAERFQATHVRYGDQIFVWGSGVPEIEKLELLSVGFDAGGSSNVDVHEGPEQLPVERLYFVTAVPRDWVMALVKAAFETGQAELYQVPVNGMLDCSVDGGPPQGTNEQGLRLVQRLQELMPAATGVTTAADGRRPHDSKRSRPPRTRELDCATATGTESVTVRAESPSRKEGKN